MIIFTVSILSYHKKSILKPINWFPIQFQTEYKLVVFGYSTSIIGNLIGSWYYYSDCTYHSPHYYNEGNLISLKNQLIISSDRSFQIVAPLPWNLLPINTLSPLHQHHLQKNVCGNRITTTQALVGFVSLAL